MDKELLKTLIEALILVLIPVFGLLLRGLIQAAVSYMDTKIGTEKLAALKGIAATAVRALAQSPVYELLDGAKKKEQAILMIQRLAASYGLQVTYEEIDSLIEEAVQRMKSELGAIPKPALVEREG